MAANSSETTATRRDSLSGADGTMSPSITAGRPPGLAGTAAAVVATSGLYGRLVCWLHRVKTVMKDSPLTVLGLSTKKSPKISEIMEQSRILCEDYIYWRLLNSGILTDGDRDAADVGVDGGKLSDVSREIQLIGTRLESAHPQLFQNVSRQVNMPLKTEAAVRRTLTSVGDFLFKHGAVTWARVVALLAIAAGVAAECVQNGHPELIGVVTSVFSDLVERHVAVWISRQGGWAELMKAFRLNKDTRNLWALTGLGTVAGFVFTWMTAMQI